jgi:hypothetical protein
MVYLKNNKIYNCVVTIDKTDFFNFNYLQDTVSVKIPINNLYNSLYLTIFFSHKDWINNSISTCDMNEDYEKSLYIELINCINVMNVTNDLITSEIDIKQEKIEEKYILCDPKLTLRLDQTKYKLLFKTNINKLHFYISNAKLAKITGDGIITPLSYGMTTMTIEGENVKKKIVLIILKKQHLTFEDIDLELLDSDCIDFNSEIDTFLPITYYSSDSKIIFINDNKGYIRTAGEVKITAFNEGNGGYERVEESQILNISSLIKKISEDCIIKHGESILLSVELQPHIKYKQIFWYLNDVKLLKHNSLTMLISNATHKNQGRYNVEVHTETRSEKSKYINITIPTPNSLNNEKNIKKVQVKNSTNDLNLVSIDNFDNKLMHNKSQNENNYTTVYEMLYNELFNKLNLKLYHNTNVQLNKLILYVYEERYINDNIIFVDVNSHKVNEVKLSNYEFDNTSVVNIYDLLLNSFYDSIYDFLYNKILYKLIERVIVDKLKKNILLKSNTDKSIIKLDPQSQVYKIYMQLIGHLYKSLSKCIFKSVYKDIIVTMKQEIKQIISKTHVDKKDDENEYLKSDDKQNAENEELKQKQLNDYVFSNYDANSIDNLRMTIDSEIKKYGPYEYTNNSPNLKMVSDVDKLLYGKQ